MLTILLHLLASSYSQQKTDSINCLTNTIFHLQCHSFLAVSFVLVTELPFVPVKTSFAKLFALRAALLYTIFSTSTACSFFKYPSLHLESCSFHLNQLFPYLKPPLMHASLFENFVTLHIPDFSSSDTKNVVTKNHTPVATASLSA